MSTHARNERRAVWVLRIAGSAILVLYVVMLAVFPSRPVRANVPGFTNPVIGFELASTPAQVFGILGEPSAPERAETVRRMDLGNRIDFLFMLAYPALYVGIALLLAAHGHIGGGVRTLLVVLAALMTVGDALENRQLFSLSAAVDPTAMSAPLGRLRTFTFLKWHAIYGASALASAFIWRERSWWRWSGLFFAAAAVLGFAGVFYLPGIELGSFVLAIAWTMTYAYALSA